MDLRQIEAFVTVAAVRSFTQAGKRLHRTQSAISQQIRHLEAELGEPLFLRDSHGVRLSSRGEHLLPPALELIGVWGTLVAEAKLLGPVSGRLSVGASGASVVYLWSEIYRGFGLTYPDVALDLRATQTTQDSLSSVRSGDLDIALAIIPKERSGLEAHALGKHEAVLCAPPNHPLTTRRRLTAADLASQRFVLFEPTTGLRWLTNELFLREKLQPNIVLESNDVHLIRTMVELGYGIGFLPDWSIQDQLKSGSLKRLPIPGRRLTQEFGLVYRRHSPSAAARAFIDFCLRHKHLLPEVARLKKKSV